MDYYLNELGVQKFALLGTDYVYPRTTNNILEAYLISKGIAKEDIFVNYTPFGHSDWSKIVGDVVALGADGKKVGVISTINGDANIGFYKELAAAGVTADTLPVVAFSVGEEELSGLDTTNLAGHLAAWNYFMSADTPENAAFIAQWKAFIKDDARVTNDPMEAHYIGFNMWVNAVTEAGTTDVDAVREKMWGQKFPNLTGGIAEMLPNHHLTKPVLIGEIRADGQFDIISQTEPVPGDRLDRLPAGIGGAGIELARPAVRDVQHADQHLRAADLQLLIHSANPLRFAPPSPPRGRGQGEGATPRLSSAPGFPMRLTALLIAAFALLAPIFLAPTPGLAQTAAEIVAQNRDQIEKPSRQTIGPVITALASSGDAMADDILTAWANKLLVIRKADDAMFLAQPEGEGFALTGLDGTPGGTAAKGEVTELKPNAGVRGLIETALVQFTLSDPDPTVRAAALTSIARDPTAEALAPLRVSLASETDPALKAQKDRLERFLTLRFDPDPAARVAAIQSLGSDTSLDVRAALNPILATTRVAVAGEPTGNVARTLTPGKDLTEEEAYDLLVTANLAPARLTLEEQRTALIANLADGSVGGVPVAELDSQSARDRAYTALEVSGAVPTAATDDEVTAALASHGLYEVYTEPDATVTSAAGAALTAIDRKVALMQAADLGLDALSLAAIFFLAAIGLAITFGVMGVINMAHGEFITIGAYTGFVVQLFVPDYTLSILIALPLAFAVTFGAGVAMERLVIRHLYKRPLETLLATFGISIALQQILKNVFGTQARPLTAPGWLDGALEFNDVVSISYIRIAIFVLALIFLAFFLYLMKRTRLGLEVRAVTQNPTMAASMGINPDRINMLTFGLGSGIAGIAGVAIGLYAKVTSEMGADYIVQSFMTVVVGGVGNVWGTLAGATMIGSLQKVIEFLNPSNTLAAQTYMILFIILFIQFRPRGIIALRGRAAGD